MSVDYLSQNFFNTCGTGYNYGCGSSYSVGNIFGGLGTSIWNMCGTYGAGTCRTKAGIRAQKRAFKQMWGQVGMALGERVVNWVLNLGAGFIQSAITNPSSETDKKGSLKSQKEELDKQINEKLGALGLKKEKDCETETAEKTATCKMFQAELDELTKTISDYDKDLKTKRDELKELGEIKSVPAETAENKEEVQAIKENNAKITELTNKIKALENEKEAAKTKQKDVNNKLEKAKEDFNTKIGEIKELIQQRNEIDAKIQAEKANKKNARKKKSSESENTQPAATKEDTNNYKDVKKLEGLLEAYNNATPDKKSAARDAFITAYQQISSKSSAKTQYKDAYDYLLQKRGTATLGV